MIVIYINYGWPKWTDSWYMTIVSILPAETPVESVGKEEEASSSYGNLRHYWTVTNRNGFRERNFQERWQFNARFIVYCAT